MRRLAATAVALLALMLPGCTISSKPSDEDTGPSLSARGLNSPAVDTRDQNGRAGITFRSGNLIEAGTATSVKELSEACKGRVAQVAFGSNNSFASGESDRLIVVCE